MKLISILLILVYTCVASAQHQHELSLTLGTSNYVGDLTPSNKWAFYELNAAAGLHYQYQFTKRFGVEAGFSIGQLSGSSHHFDSDYQTANLHFRTTLFELAVLAIFNILPYDTQVKEKTWTPFVYAGLAGFHFNPRTKYKGDWHKLQPLSTEAQSPYNLTQLSFPFGFGAKFSMSSRLAISLSVGARYTLTDYIDDVSQNYVALDELARNYGELSVQLSNRTYDLEGQQIERAGQARGQMAGNDWYILSSIGIHYQLGKITLKKPSRKVNYELHKWM